MKSARRTEVSGSGHVRVYASQEDLEDLEKMKVFRMSEELLTGYQRARRDVLIASKGSTD